MSKHYLGLKSDQIPEIDGIDFGGDYAYDLQNLQNMLTGKPGY